MSLEDRMRLSEDRRTIHIPLLGLQIPARTVNVRTTQGIRTARRAVMDIGFLDDPTAFALATKRMQAERRMEKPAAETELRRIAGKCFLPYLIQAPDGLVQMVATTYWDQRDDARNTFVRGHENGHAVARLDALELLEEAIRTETGLQFQLKGYRDEVIASIAGLFALHKKGIVYDETFSRYTAAQIAKAIWIEKELIRSTKNRRIFGTDNGQSSERPVSKEDAKVEERKETPKAEEKPEPVGNNTILYYNFSAELNKFTPTHEFFPRFEEDMGDVELELILKGGERVRIPDWYNRTIPTNTRDPKAGEGAAYTIRGLNITKEQIEDYIRTASEDRTLHVRKADKRLPKIMEFLASLAIDEYKLRIIGNDWKADVKKRLQGDDVQLEFDISTTRNGTDNLEIELTGSNHGLFTYFAHQHAIFKPEYFPEVHTSRTGNKIIGPGWVHTHERGLKEARSMLIAKTGEHCIAGYLFSFFFPDFSAQEIPEEVRERYRKKEVAGMSVGYAYGRAAAHPWEYPMAEVFSYAPIDILKRIMLGGENFHDRFKRLEQSGGNDQSLKPIPLENQISLVYAMEDQFGGEMSRIGEHWRNAFYEAYGEGALIKTTETAVEAFRADKPPGETDPKLEAALAYAKTKNRPSTINGKRVVDLGQGPAYLLVKHGGVRFEHEA